MEHEEFTTTKSAVSVQKQGDATTQYASAQNRSSHAQATQTKEAVKTRLRMLQQISSSKRARVLTMHVRPPAKLPRTPKRVPNRPPTRCCFADALRQTGGTLQERQEDAVADYANVAADQLEKFSGYLRQQDLGNILQEIQGFARRQPEVFVAGTLAAGFRLGRLFKSSSGRSNQSQWNQGYNQGYGQSAGMYGSQQYNQYSGSGYGSQYDSADYRGQMGSTGMSGQSGAQAQETVKERLNRISWGQNHTR